MCAYLSLGDGIGVFFFSYCSLSPLFWSICERAHAFLYFIIFDLRLMSASRSGSTKSGTRRNVNPDPRRLQGCTPLIGYAWFDLHGSKILSAQKEKKKLVCVTSGQCVRQPSITQDCCIVQTY
ncbi:unnamed protein product [Ixodes pacificus]